MAWIPHYVILIALSTVIDYGAGLLMERARGVHKRRLYLFFSLFSNLGLLFLFKYYNFFVGSVLQCASWFNIPVSLTFSHLLLPVGISFYTFQTLSYSIDIYKKNRRAERHFGYFALYVSFFPQLVAGPIERSDRLLPELKKESLFDIERVKDGLSLMVWGMFKKVVIADRLAFFVDSVYGKSDHYSGFYLSLATLFFAFQIFCDFSGYSDIAIGAAKVLGINLMTNFNKPYFARSIHEFWSRWHISLSTWFRDYVYIPLGGSRVPLNRHYFNLFITFLISGLWHGANWTFVAWGALNGLYLICGQATKKMRQSLLFFLRIPEDRFFIVFVNILFTFFLTNIAWIFFRAASIKDAFSILAKLHQGWDIIFHPEVVWKSFEFLRFQEDFIVGVIAIGVMLVIHTVRGNLSFINFLKSRSVYFRFFLFSILLSLLYVSLDFTTKHQFIYFQF